MKALVRNDEMALFLGMVFFWSYFRFRNFFGYLFPLSTEIPFGSTSVQAYSILLMSLGILSLTALIASSRLEALLRAKSAFVPLATASGSLGVIIMGTVAHGFVSPAATYLSAFLISVSFIVAFVAWAIYCSHIFSPKLLVLLSASFFTSILLAPLTSLPPLTWIILVVTPIGTGLAYYFAKPPPLLFKKKPSEKNLGNKGVQTSKALISKTPVLCGREYKPLQNLKLCLKSANVLIWVFIAFLIAGSVMRGIIDVERISQGDSPVRYAVSIAFVSLVLTTALFYQRSQTRSIKTTPEHGTLENTESLFRQRKAYNSFETYVLKWLFILVLFFFSGIFLSLFSEVHALGGNIVVIARSTLSFFLWLLLCNLALYKKLSPVTLFITFGLFVEVVSWTISYIVMPLVLHFGATTNTSAISALLTAFLAITVMTAAFAVVSFRRRVNIEDTQSTKNHSSNVSDDQKNKCDETLLPAEIIEFYRLTKREAEVIHLFSQGLSLKRVATLLFISPSTAQSHMKSIYRKLNIHSKNELVEMAQHWR